MKRFASALLLIVLACSLSLSTAAAASKGSGGSKAGGTKSVHVKGYTKKDGTHVEGHDRTAPTTKTEKAADRPVPSAPAAVDHKERERIQRSDAARHAFARHTGYPHGRPGYVIDHIRPLACGGADAPANMQWQTAAEAKAKDKTERIGC
jgi:hypothetical protein